MSTSILYKKYYSYLVSFGNTLQAPLLLLLRLYWGFSFFLSGVGKFEHIDGVILFFMDLGIPFPVFNSYLAAFTELVGGFCLLIGLAARLVSIPLALTMIVALLTAHKETFSVIFTTPEVFVMQTAFIYFLICLIIFTFGPGKFSVDYYLKSNRKKLSEKK